MAGGAVTTARAEHRLGALRWALPAGLLAGEAFALSLAVDLPLDGPALRLAQAIRLAFPVVLGSAVAAALLAGRGIRAAVVALDAALPPWRPARPLALHLLAFGVTAALVLGVLGAGAPPPSAGALAACLAAAILTALLALATAGPLPALAREAARRWWGPLLAVAVGLLAWWAADAAEALWGPLSGASLAAAAWLVRAVAGDVHVDVPARAIGVGDFEVEVSSICSGADGVGLVVLFLAVWLALSRRRLRVGRALLLVPAAVAAALAANVVRIAALVLVGGAGHEDLAMGGFHSKLGWFLFCGIALGSVAVAERLPALRREGGAPPIDGAAGSDEAGAAIARRAGAYVAPLVAALAAALATHMLASGPVDRGYGLRALAALAALALVREDLPRPSLSLAATPVLLGVATAVLWVAWPGSDPAPVARALAALGPVERIAWLATRLAASVLVIPVVEELAFRGLLLPWLVAPDLRASPRAWTPAAVVLSSLAFGALHPQWFAGALVGVAFAAARCWRGRLSDAVVAHAVCNLGVALAALAWGRLDLWG